MTGSIIVITLKNVLIKMSLYFFQEIYNIQEMSLNLINATFPRNSTGCMIVITTKLLKKYDIEPKHVSGNISVINEIFSRILQLEI